MQYNVNVRHDGKAQPNFNEVDGGLNILNFVLPVQRYARGT